MFYTLWFLVSYSVLDLCIDYISQPLLFIYPTAESAFHGINSPAYAREFPESSTHDDLIQFPASIGFHGPTETPTPSPLPSVTTD